MSDQRDEYECTADMDTTAALEDARHTTSARLAEIAGMKIGLTDEERAGMGRLGFTAGVFSCIPRDDARVRFTLWAFSTVCGEYRGIATRAYARDGDPDSLIVARIRASAAELIAVAAAVRETNEWPPEA